MPAPRLFRSLRRRLVVVSCVYIGVVLAIFAFGIYRYWAKLSLQRIEAAMAADTQELLGNPYAADYYRFERTLADQHRRDDGHATFIFYAYNDDDFYRSADWPLDLDPRFIDSQALVPANWLDPFVGTPPPRSELAPGTGPGFRNPRAAADDTGAGPPSNPVFTWDRREFDVAGERWFFVVYGNLDETLILGRRLDDLGRETAPMRTALLTALPLAVVVTLFGALALARSATRPLREFSAQFDTLTMQTLDRRLPKEPYDLEFHPLIDSFNDLLSRLAASFDNVSRFTGEAAHELKTPLTILQGRLRESIRLEDTGSARQELLGGLMDEVVRLKSITERLLLLSRLDAGQIEFLPEKVDLTDILRNLIEDATALDANLNVACDIPSGLAVVGDRTLLIQVLHNLLSNAVKYNDDRARVEIRARPKGEHIHVAFANTGPEIPADQREEIFRRFYRGERSRWRKVDGFGLGLAIARDIARAHGGELTFVGSQGGMNLFLLTLREWTSDTPPAPKP